MSNPENFNQNENEIPQEPQIADQVEEFLAKIAVEWQLDEESNDVRDDPFGEEEDRLTAKIKPRILGAFEAKGFILDIASGKTLDEAYIELQYKFDANIGKYESFAARYEVASDADRITLDTEADERYETYRTTHFALIEKSTLLYYANKISSVLVSKVQFADDPGSYRRLVNDEAAALVAVVQGDAVFDETEKQKLMNICKSLLGEELFTAAVNQAQAEDIVQKNLAADLSELDIAIEKNEFKQGLQEFLQALGAAPATHDEWAPLLKDVTRARWARFTTYSDDQVAFQNLFQGTLSEIRMRAMRLGLDAKVFNILLSRLLQIDDTL